MFMYLGRRGSLGQLTLQVARAAAAYENLDATITIAGMSEIAPKLEALGDRLFKLETYRTRPYVSIVLNFLSARRRLLAKLAEDRPAAVVTLMPHIWTPLLAPGIKQLGVRYISIAHDAVSHPGDPTAVLTPWLVRDAKLADTVVTLSRTVADRLVSTHLVPVEKVVTLFHPDLNYNSAGIARRRDLTAPLRLLFFGRIMKYKGLPLLLDAVELLRREGLNLKLGVAGAGNLQSERSRLAVLGAEVVNRWIDDDEVGPLLARYDAVALSHIEASQSGVAATAFGNGMPVVGMPVGGLAEQIVDGRTGVLAQRMTVRAFADAIRRLANEPGLYDSIVDHLRVSAENRSMRRFLDRIIAEVTRPA
jgi:glycosyltransferase involved in cell wall biosynthesis